MCETVPLTISEVNNNQKRIDSVIQNSSKPLLLHPTSLKITSLDSKERERGCGGEKL